VRAPYRLERRYATSVVRGNIVDSHAASRRLEAYIALLVDSMKASILSPEEHGAGPIVGKVLRKCTTGA
jgi:hypothetical protein